MARAPAALLPALALLIGGVTSLAQQSMPTSGTEPLLRISGNGKQFTDSDGKPVFLTGDTAWRIVSQLTREEMLVYLDKRKAQGFNTILFTALPWPNDTTGNQNVYGAEPFHRTMAGYDPTRPSVTPNSRLDEPGEYDYWDHVDFFVESAERKGIYVAMLPCWGRRWINGEDSGFTRATAYAYGHWLGVRYRRYGHILWVLGGDVRPGDKIPIYRAMAEGLADGTNGVNSPDGRADYSTTLMSYHDPKEWSENPDEYDTSATWFHGDPWLDFNSCQEHPEKAARAILKDFGREPARPAWLFEGRYEDYQKDSNTPVWNAWGIRYQAYQSVFSGGFGHVYGHEGVYSFGSPAQRAPNVDWQKNLDASGAWQVQHLADLMGMLTTEQFLDREPAQELIAGRIGLSPLSNDPRNGSDRVTATRAADGSIVMVYIANGRLVSIRMGELAGPRANAYWYNPRSGRWRVGGDEYDSMKPFLSGLASGGSAGTLEFDPPGDAANGNDWVLILKCR